MRAAKWMAASAALVVSVVGRQGSAAPPPTSDITARATELFRAGRAAASAGDDKTACARFAESEQLQPAPGTQLNLGACEAKQGHVLAAREHYRLAAEAFGPEDRRRAVAVNSANELTARLAVLTVHIANGAPPDTTVTIAGAAVDAKALEQGVELDPGKTRLVVNADKRQSRPYDLELADSEKRALTVEAGDPVPDTTGASTPPPSASSDDAKRARALQRTLGFVGAGAGAAGVVLGSIFGGLAFSEASTVKANCNASLACKPAGVSAASSGETDGAVSTTAFVVGAVLGAAGVYLIIRTWHDPNDGEPKTSSITLAPLATRSGGGMIATWAF
jgi:hypothetical protein